MGQNLTGQLISATYEDLVQISGSILTDGTGSDITNISITASNAVSSSYALTASFAENVTPIDTGSFLTTASISDATVTFTKADASTFAITVNNVQNAFTASLADNTYIQVKNMEATQIDKGTPCYISASGTAGNIAGIYVADAGNALRMPAGVIAGEDLAAGVEGIGFLNGFINGVDTTAFASGDEIFVAVGGGYTNVAPTGSANFIQHLGYVEKSAVNGSGVINMSGEARGLPNILQGYLWVGDANGVPQAVISSSIVVDNAVSASYSLTSTSASHAINSDSAISASHAVNADIAISSSHAVNADTAISSSYALTATSSSHALNADNAISSSYALTASFAQNVTPAFPFTGSARITGSLGVTGSVTITGTSFHLNSNNNSGDPGAGGNVANIASGGSTVNANARNAGIVGGTGNILNNNAFQSFIGGGALNNVNQIRTVAVGGYNNLMSCPDGAAFNTQNSILRNGGFGFNSTVLSGESHLIDGGSVTNSAIIAGKSNFINNVPRSVILGGQNITASVADTVYVPNLHVSGSTLISGSLIQGNTGNSVSDPYSAIIAGGNGNSVTATQAVIIAGVNSNTNNAGGGAMVATDGSTMSGGYGLMAGCLFSNQSGTGTITLGGDTQTNNSNKTAIVAGSTHTINSSSDLSAIVGGQSNVVTSGHTGSVVLGGTALATTKSDEVVVPRLTISGSFVDTVVISNYASINFADDTAAAAGGIPLGGVYRNGNFLMIRIV